jgi:cyclohexa-1,5-dienecarbonyl-CoA hydratase
MAFQNITLEKKDGIARLNINRPPVNVMNYDTIAEITTALEDIQKDADVKVVLFRGAGTRAFCAGVEVKDHLGDMVPKMMTGFEKMIKALKGMKMPTIAVVNGVALGGGCEVVAACDMAIASEKAQLGQPEIKLGGLAPAAAALFPKIMGQKKTFELIVLGDNITAQAAEKIGLVNMVVPDAELDAAADKLAAKFTAMTPIGVRLVKDAVNQCINTADFDSSLRKATELGIKSWETYDAQEGLKSYLEKRPAVWKNK